jgi:hypothetical protein
MNTLGSPAYETQVPSSVLSNTVDQPTVGSSNAGLSEPDLQHELIYGSRTNKRRRLGQPSQRSLLGRLSTNRRLDSQSRTRQMMPQCISLLLFWSDACTIMMRRKVVRGGIFLRLEESVRLTTLTTTYTWLKGLRFTQEST